MPDQKSDAMLDSLLEYNEDLPADAFVLDVMQRVRRERRRRRLILMVFGLIGAAFGLAGALLLSEPLTRTFTGMPPIGTTQVVLFVVAAVAFYAWFMNEDVDLAF